MEGKLVQKIKYYMSDRKRRRKFFCIMSLLSCFTAFAVYGALMFPAISMEGENPLLEADINDAYIGTGITVDVKSSFLEEQEETCILLYSKSEDAGLADTYVFESDAVSITDEDGNSRVLNRELETDGDMGTYYWYTLSGQENATLNLRFTADTSKELSAAGVTLYGTAAPTLEEAKANILALKSDSEYEPLELSWIQEEQSAEEEAAEEKKSETSESAIKAETPAAVEGSSESGGGGEGDSAENESESGESESSSSISLGGGSSGGGSSGGGSSGGGGGSSGGSGSSSGGGGSSSESLGSEEEDEELFEAEDEELFEAEMTEVVMDFEEVSESEEVPFIYDMKWIAGGAERSIPEGGQNLTINPTEYGNVTAALQVDLCLGDKGSKASGEVEIRLPAHIFLNDAGKPVDVLDVGLSPIGLNAGESGLGYDIDGKGTVDTADDEVVISNYKTIEANSYITFPVSYSYKPSELEDGYSKSGISGTLKFKDSGGSWQSVSSLQSLEVTSYRVPRVLTNIGVCLMWDDDGATVDHSSDEMTVHLYKDGLDTGTTLVLKESTDWYGYFENLDTKDGEGNEISYSVVEEPKSGYDISYTKSDITYSGGVVTQIGNVNGKDICIRNIRLPVSTTSAIFALVDKDNQSNALTGAAFTLYIAAVNGSGEWYAVDPETSIGYFKVSNTGSLTIDNLVKGRKYLLVETRAPAAFQIPDKGWRIDVKTDGTVEVYDSSGSPVSKQLNHWMLFNQGMYKLPNTGGMGILTLYFISFLIMIAASMLLIRKIWIYIRAYNQLE